MQRNPVKSSIIASVGYDAESYILEIEFKQGGIWEFFDITPQLHKKFINAESLGKFFAKNIKGIYLEARSE